MNYPVEVRARRASVYITSGKALKVLSYRLQFLSVKINKFSSF